MKRVILGWVLLVHAIAHASAGMWMLERGPALFVTALWTVTVAGYFAAALALFRFPWLRDHWKPIVLAATMVSIVALLWYAPPWGVIGCAIDIALMLVTLDLAQPAIDADIAAFEHDGMASVGHPRCLCVSWTLGALALAYVTAVTITRPILARWGTTPQLRMAAVAGDEMPARVASYRIDHAIVIRAPAGVVWPWLVSATERVQPAAHVATSGFWVTALEPDRVLGIERWATFMLDPIDSATTRLVVRARAPEPTSFTAFLLSPIEVFVLEPAHFIVERSMLLGIRARAERSVAARTG